MQIGKVLLITGSTKEYINNDLYISSDFDETYNEKIFQYLYLTQHFSKTFILKSDNVDLKFYDKIKSYTYVSDETLSSTLKSIINKYDLVIDLSSRFDLIFNKKDQIPPFITEEDFLVLINKGFKSTALTLDVIENRSESTKYIKYLTTNYNKESFVLNQGVAFLNGLNCNRVIIKNINGQVTQYYIIRPNKTFLKTDSITESIHLLFNDIINKVS